MALDSTFSPVLTSLLPLDVWVRAFVSFLLWRTPSLFHFLSFLFYMGDSSAGARKAPRRTIADINAGIAALVKPKAALEAAPHDVLAQEQGAVDPGSSLRKEVARLTQEVAARDAMVRDLRLEIIGHKAEIEKLAKQIADG